MTRNEDPYAVVKRKIRRLKNMEHMIRYGPGAFSVNNGVPLAHPVWDAFFSKRANGAEAKYPLEKLLDMDNEAYQQVVEEFLYQVYYQVMPSHYLNKEVHNHVEPVYDPERLSQMGLPPDADTSSVRRRFRELAKKYHPDSGGDSALFVELMALYRALDENKK